jgi:hypothetical protein
MNGGRKPKPASEKKDLRRRFHFCESDLALAGKLAGELNCTESEVFSRALHHLGQEVEQQKLPIEGRLSGDADIVRRKRLALEAFAVLGNGAVAAARAGVCTRTVRSWVETDPIFAERAQAVQAAAVGQIRSKMWEKAAEGHTSSMFGILNAFDPEFGQIRAAMINRVVTPLLEAAAKSASQFLTHDQLLIYSADVQRAFSQISLGATANVKRR